MHTDLPNKKFEKDESVLEDLSSKKDTKNRKDSEKEQSENVFYLTLAICQLLKY